MAASHVLHRLLLPRHPPCALSSLIIKLIQRRILAWLCSQTQILRCQFYSPYWICSSRTGFLRKLPPQQISKVLIKLLLSFKFALYLPNLFSCQTSSCGSHRNAAYAAISFHRTRNKDPSGDGCSIFKIKLLAFTFP